MYQALEAVIDFAFNTLDFHRIEADVDLQNAGSLGLLEKLGFKREGFFRERWYVYNQWQDSVMLGLLKQDWQSRKTSTADK
jgi:RimJ/RimL family protein N-acetyltransferase